MQDSELYYRYLAGKLQLRDSLTLFYHPGHGYPIVESVLRHHNLVTGICELSDKARFSRLIQGPGIPYSTVYRPQSPDTSAVRFPCLAKPPNRGSGKGIEVIRTPADLAKLRGSARVLSQYIEHPRCHNGAKADVRMYVLFCPHSQEAYLYPDGIVRVSTVQYQPMGECSDRLIHITNNQVHKKRDGHTNLLLTQWIIKESERQQVWLRLVPILRAIFSAFLLKHPPTDPRAFTILGFDVLIDESLQPWVLEFNVDWDSGMPNVLWGSVSLPMFDSFLSVVTTAKPYAESPIFNAEEPLPSSTQISDLLKVSWCTPSPRSLPLVKFLTSTSQVGKQTCKSKRKR